MRSERGRRTILRLFAPLAIAVALVASACGAENGYSNDPATTGPVSASPNRATATPVVVRETEFTIELPTAQFAPGTYTFAVENAGAAPHDLVIKGPGVDSARTEQIGSGSTEQLTVTLQPGTYEVWCSVGNHRQRGMSTEIIVK